MLSLRTEWFKDITNYREDNELSFKNTALIPRIGLGYELNENVNLYATYLEGYQPQSNTVALMPSTVNYFWASESAAQFDPLISDLIELGFKTELFKKRFTWTGALYQINQKNILMSANDPDNPDLLTQRGADRSRGFETDLAGYILPNWQINASYSFVDAKIVYDDDETLIGERKENTPRHGGNLWTRYNLPSIGKGNRIGFGLGINAQGSRIPWYTRAFKLPAFVVADAAIYYTAPGNKLQVALNVNNVFDQTYWNGAQTLTRLFPGEPRNFMLTSTYRF